MKIFNFFNYTSLLVLYVLVLVNSSNYKAINFENIKTEEAPLYKLLPISSGCSFEILVNDIPLYKFFEKTSGGVGGTAIPMNWNISKTGKQKITIRMYPGFNVDENKFNLTLGKNAGVKFIIEKEENGEEENIFEYKTAFVDFDGKGNGGFLYPDKPFHEEIVYIDLKVPYQIDILENSQTLITKDKEKLKLLEKEVLLKYNEIRNIYMSGTKDQLANISYKKEKRIAQQMFLTTEEIKDRWDNDYQFRTDKNLEFFDLKPIEDYTMSFYGDGKLVCLEKINNKKSSLWGGFKRKDKDVVTTTYIILYLYKPNGKSEFEVY